MAETNKKSTSHNVVVYNHPSVSHKDDTYTFWDTAGLNENELVTVPHQTAVQNLQAIIKESNPDLLICCKRDRLVNIVRDNYNSIYTEKIPMVLVVTRLESKVDMDGWWNENEKTIKKMKMSFVGHAYITIWKGKHGIFGGARTID